MRKYLTTKEAAEVLGVRQSSLLRRVQRRSVKGKKVGWVWLIPEKEVIRLKGMVNADN